MRLLPSVSRSVFNVRTSLCGARKPEQVLDNAGAMHIKLDGADAVRMKWDVDAIS